MVMMGKWEMVLGVTDPQRWRQLLDEGFEPFAVAYGPPSGIVSLGETTATPIVSFKKFYVREDGKQQ